MARRRRGRPLDGILILDKPAGMTSNRALQQVKFLYGAAKAGHTGSLDPMATGVLPICFGEATKLSQYLLDADKIYESVFRLGISTETGDAEGEERARHDASGVTLQAIEALLPRFRGAIKQVPSMYSAIKHNGQPLYKLAREGITVEREPRDVFIHRFDIEDFQPGEVAQLRVLIHCSKGTYVRSLAEDLGEALGCGAHVSALRRTAAGPFELGQSVTLATLEALKARDERAQMDSLLLPPASALTDMPTVTLSESSGFYLRQGQPVLVPNAPCDGMVRVALESGEFLGVGEILDDGRVAPRRLMVTTR
jgi:tRNA pseudouridine55 synthase